MKNKKSEELFTLKEKVDNFLHLPDKTKIELFVDKLCYVMIEEEWSPEKAFEWLQADKDHCIKNKYNNENMDLNGFTANVKMHQMDKILDAYNKFLKHD